MKVLPVAPLAICLACAGLGSGSEGAAPTPAPDVVLHEVRGTELVPPGYGSLRQEDIAVRIQLPGVQVRLIPLDESVIRVLSPDSYVALRELQEGNRSAITGVATRYGVRAPSLWYASFYGLQPEARFSPMEMVIGSAGRDHRPLDFVPLSTSFGQQIRQREVQSAIYVFEEGINVNQPLVIIVETVRSTSWSAILRVIERERALIRSRATAPR